MCQQILFRRENKSENRVRGSKQHGFARHLLQSKTYLGDRVLAKSLIVPDLKSECKGEWGSKPKNDNFCQGGGQKKNSS